MKLTDIDGIGNKLLEKLKSDNVKCIKDLYKLEIYNTLPLQSKAYLRVCPTSIQRDSAKKIKSIFRKIFSSFKITGSYRRKRNLLNDIDIVVLKSNYLKGKKYFQLYDPEKDNYIQLNGMKIYTFAIGKEKVNAYITLGNIKTRIDINITSKKQYPFMMIYTTGSKMFNIRMRGIAKKKGYILNQNGLYKNDKLIPNLNTEKKVFEYLKMNYLTPEKRDIQ